MKRSSLWLTLGVLLLVASLTYAAEPVADRIVYLQIEITESSARLMEVGVVDGHLKRPRHAEIHAGGLRIEVLDADANRIFQVGAEDPTHEILEYVDESGKLQSKLIEKEHGTAFIRLPFDPAAALVSVSRVLDTEVEGGATRAAVRHLGTFKADWTEVTDDE